MIDLRTPGVEVRPIRQISGASLFSEVFLTDVQVPIANRVGAENVHTDADLFLNFDRTAMVSSTEIKAGIIRSA